MKNTRSTLLHALMLVALGLGNACGGPPKQAGDADDFDVVLEPSSKNAGSSDDDGSSGSDWEASDNEDAEMNDAQKEQIQVALRRGTDKSAECSSVVETPTTGEGEVYVVLDGTKGRITDVEVGAPFAGTDTEACIKRSFIGEIILPFEGELKKVAHTVKVPPKGKK